MREKNIMMENGQPLSEELLKTSFEIYVLALAELQELDIA